MIESLRVLFLVIAATTVAGVQAAGDGAAQSDRPSAAKSAGKSNTAKSAQRSGKPSATPVARARDKARPTAQAVRPSHGQLAGLRATPDDLALKSSVALVVDQDKIGRAHV